jgi:hypothetical protein
MSWDVISVWRLRFLTVKRVDNQQPENNCWEHQLGHVDSSQEVIHVVVHLWAQVQQPFLLDKR